MIYLIYVLAYLMIGSLFTSYCMKLTKDEWENDIISLFIIFWPFLSCVVIIMFVMSMFIRVSKLINKN
jgi:hypothetical protein